MEKMKTTAKGLDVFLHVVCVLLTVSAVACLVGLGIIGAGVAFDLAPEQIGTGYATLEVGYLELELAEGYVPAFDSILLLAAVGVALGSVSAWMARGAVKCMRRMLQPVKEGRPFQSVMSQNLKKLAAYCLALGIVANVMTLLARALMVGKMDLASLLLSEKVVGVTVNYSLDLGFLVVSALLLLLSYVFRYGEQLQQMSDETL